MRSVLVTVAASWLTVAASVASAESPPSASPPPSDSSVPLERLIASVAKKTGKTFVVDPRVHADVVIIGRAPAEVSYAELLGVLDVYGFAGVEDSGFVRVIPDSAIKMQAVPTISPKDTRPASEYVSQIVTVKNVPAAQLVPILRPMIPQSGSMVAFSATNSLIIVDRFANLRRVEALIRALDSTPLSKSQAAAPASGESAATEH
jgi:type II secretory pathway component GspD/PulD (secretin)